MNPFEQLFSSEKFMPHGSCYMWDQSLIWLHVISDGLITVSYYSIPITGKMEFNPEEFSLGKAIEEVCAVTNSIAEKKGIRLEMNLAPDLGCITLDQQRFKQVLYNLLSNAIKFTDNDGKVEIRAAMDDGLRFKLVVQDTGVGISKEIAATSKVLVKTINDVTEAAEQTAILACTGQNGLARMEATMRQVMEAGGAVNAKFAVLNEKASTSTRS